jgi:hypothetical protein
LGQVVGIYYDASFGAHAFIRQQDGAWSSFDVPGGNFGFFLSKLCINDAGDVAGYYLDAQTRGFFRAADGTFTSFMVPGSTSTMPWGLNASGTVTGT